MPTEKKKDVFSGAEYTVESFDLRASDLILEKMFNPANASNLGGVSQLELVERCGIIPDFFATAVATGNPRGLTLDTISKSMNEQYVFGGFSDSWKFLMDEKGLLHYEGDDPYIPLVRFDYLHFSLYVYQYGIVALVDHKMGNKIFGRFD